MFNDISCGTKDTADAVQVNMEDAPTLLEMPKSECPDMWIRPPRVRRFPTGNAFSCNVRKGLLSSMYVDDAKKLIGNKQNIDPMW